MTLEQPESELKIDHAQLPRRRLFGLRDGATTSRIHLERLVAEVAKAR
jgi:hypothetical protein